MTSPQPPRSSSASGSSAQPPASRADRATAPPGIRPHPSTATTTPHADVGQPLAPRPPQQPRPGGLGAPTDAESPQQLHPGGPAAPLDAESPQQLHPGGLPAPLAAESPRQLPPGGPA